METFAVAPLLADVVATISPPAARNWRRSSMSKILLVEDDRANRELLARYLTLLGTYSGRSGRASASSAARNRSP